MSLRPSRPWHGSAVTVAFCLTLLACEKDAPGPPPAASVARLVAVAGSVEVLRGAARLKGSTGGDLAAGDQVLTGADGSARIAYLDGTELELGPGGRFRLEGSREALTLVLEEGALLTRARAADGGGGQRLTVRTDFGSTVLEAGAELQFNLTPARKSLQVIYGEATLLGADGTRRTVAVGETLELSLGSARDAGPPSLEAEVLELVLSPQRGTTLVRRKGEARFSPAAAAPIAAGTAFKVLPTATAVLEGQGVRLQLAGGATGSVGKGAREGGARRYELGLDSGEAQMLVTGEGAREVLLGAHGRMAPLALRASESSAAALSATAHSTRIEVRAGELTLGAGADARVLKAGEVAELTGAELQVSARSRPALVLSAERRARVFADGLRDVAVALPEGSTGPLKVEVATDAAFTQKLLEGSAPAEYVVLTPPMAGALFWRFSPAAGASTQGEAVFERDGGRFTLKASAPHADVTETGLKATVYFQSTAPELTFSYASRDGAGRYRLRVYREGELATPVADKTVEDTQCTLAPGSLGEGSYVWYAAPLDGAGTELPGGRMNKLELIEDNFRRTLAIARPRVNERVGRRPVQAEGLAPVGARLSINGRPAVVDGKGRFRIQVPAADTLVFRLSSDGGADSFWVRALRKGQR